MWYQPQCQKFSGYDLLDNLVYAPFPTKSLDQMTFGGSLEPGLFYDSRKDKAPCFPAQTEQRQWQLLLQGPITLYLQP